MVDVIMLLGGSSSGKSANAENLARELEAQTAWPVYYLATGTIWDDEFARRVERHRQRRPAVWTTIEESCDLAGVIRNHKEYPAIFLVDGVGTWLTNLMFEKMESVFSWDAAREAQCIARVQDFIKAWEQVEGVLILVADEVGMDVVPDNLQARIFRDLNGQVNQMLTQEALTVYWVVAGIPVCLKGGSG